jgi:hypothetical protein
VTQEARCTEQPSTGCSTPRQNTPEVTAQQVTTRPCRPCRAARTHPRKVGKEMMKFRSSVEISRWAGSCCPHPGRTHAPHPHPTSHTSACLHPTHPTPHSVQPAQPQQPAAHTPHTHTHFTHQRLPAPHPTPCPISVPAPDHAALPSPLPTGSLSCGRARAAGRGV